MSVDRFLNGLRLDDTRLCGLREYPTELDGLHIGTLPNDFHMLIINYQLRLLEVF